MIGAYVHHHGRGHRTRVGAVAACLREEVVLFGSDPPPGAARESGVPRWVALDVDDDCGPFVDPQAGGTMHWAPVRHPGYRTRMAELAGWAERMSVGWVDVSVEVALLWRTLGVPTVVSVLPGERGDAPHELVHRQAAAILAAWPDWVPLPAHLEPVADRVHRVGGISRFASRPRPAPGRDDGDASRPRIVVFGGAGGASEGPDYWPEVARRCRSSQLTVLGGASGGWVDDPWPLLCEADLVVSHAGQGAIADLACAGTPAVVVPVERPFGEQHATADVLRTHGVTEVWERLPPPEVTARRLDAVDPTDRARRDRASDAWSRWGTGRAARRAATLLECLAAGRAPTPTEGS